LCTLTLLRSGLGPSVRGNDQPRARIVMNRDEQRTRPAALGPRVVACPPRMAIMPVDPISGGTWIGCNDRGIAACLLNSTHDVRSSPASMGLRSRGGVVPLLLAAADFDGALQLARSLDAAAFPAFRVLITDASRHAVLRADGVATRVEALAPIDDGVMLTSSGLGDELVQQPRRVVFDQMIAAEASPQQLRDIEHLREAQDSFHAWTGGDQPALNVNMNRADARTVSITVIELFDDRATLEYTPLGDDLSASSTSEQASISFESVRRFA